LKYDYLLIDIEGTLVKDKTFTPVDGAPHWVRRLSREGKHFILITNNTTHTPDDLYELMLDKGFTFKVRQLLTCISAGADYLKRMKCSSCFVIGSPAIKRHLRSKGFEIRNSADVDAVAVGLDEKLSFAKLRTATAALVKNDARLCGMHKNRLYVDRRGRISFSAGPIVKALEYASGKRAYISGKPSPGMFRRALSGWGCPPEKVLMISDDPLSDLRGARKMGMGTCFVKSGAYPDESVLQRLNRDEKPDYVLNSVADITFIFE
jgi:HAD superfamily hydrolase (TIGR01450 family)